VKWIRDKVVHATAMGTPQIYKKKIYSAGGGGPGTATSGLLVAWKTGKKIHTRRTLRFESVSTH
jgi:hypothetical protein